MPLSKVKITSEDDEVKIEVDGEEVKNVKSYNIVHYAPDPWAERSLDILVDDVKIDGLEMRVERSDEVPDVQVFDSEAPGGIRVHELRGRATGLDRIASERLRQIEEEGWSLEHDQAHDPFILPAAAACYVAFATSQLRFPGKANPEVTPLGWPFDAEWWKPSEDPRRNLEKAGALIAAALDR